MSILTKVEASKATTQKMFNKGTPVEVSSDEDGFAGAWFAATVVEAAGKDKFLVQYQSLRTDDDFRLSERRVWYPAYEAMSTRNSCCWSFESFWRSWCFLQFYNYGWWVGVISMVLGGSKYLVYFRDTDEEIEFKHSDLRLHQDWIDGKWIAASQVWHSKPFNNFVDMCS